MAKDKWKNGGGRGNENDTMDFLGGEWKEGEKWGAGKKISAALAPLMP
jgi:hypothetical protein